MNNTDSTNLATKYRPNSFEEVLGQEKTIASIKKILESDKKLPDAILFSGPSGVGKAQPLTSKILTPNGWKLMGEVKIGEEIIGSDGQNQYITNIFPQGIMEVYELKFDDGAIVRCSKDHLWQVNIPVQFARRFNNKILLPTSVFIDNDLYFHHKDGSKRSKFFFPLVRAIQFPSINSLIDPYIIGLLLGDGGLTQITPVISNADESLLQEAREILSIISVELKYSDQYDYRLRGVAGKNALANHIKNLGLQGTTSHTKFIPNLYKFASIDERISLLQGLCDTDGHTNGTNVEISTTSNAMAQDIIDIVRSLGGIGSITDKPTSWVYKGIKKYSRTNRLIFSLPKGIIPFRLPEKINNFKQRTKYDLYRRLESISFIGEEEVQCIKVNSYNGLYVTDDYVLTHNTTLARVCAKAVGTDEGNILEKDAASNSGVDEMRSVIEQTQFLPLGTNKTRVVIIDECHRLSKQAVESLLKNLEEPNKGTTWILCTTEPSKVLKTIITRCHHYQLSEVSTLLIAARLIQISEKENLSLDKKITNFIATKCHGSPRQAITYLSQSRACTSLDEVREVIKSVDSNETPEVFKLCNLLLQGDSANWKEVLEAVRGLNPDECEGTRRIVINVMNKRMFTTEDPTKASDIVRVLFAFTSQGVWDPSDKYGPLFVAIGRICLK